MWLTDVSPEDFARARASFPEGVVLPARSAIFSPPPSRWREPPAPLHRHYFEVMPAVRREQLRHPLLGAPLDWRRLPRLSGALDAPFAMLDTAGVAAETAATDSTPRPGWP